MWSFYPISSLQRLAGSSYGTKVDLNNFVALVWGIDFFEVAQDPRVNRPNLEHFKEL